MADYIKDVEMFNSNLLFLRWKWKGVVVGDGEVILLSYLIDKSKEETSGCECNVSNEDILKYLKLEDTHINRRLVSRRMKKLKDAGFISVDGRPPKRTIHINVQRLNRLIDMRVNSVF